MTNLNPKSSGFPETSRKQSYKKKHVNWHVAACCAIQIDLRDYSHLLEFLTEYPLGKGSYRIDLLLIKNYQTSRFPKTLQKYLKPLISLKSRGSVHH